MVAYRALYVLNWVYLAYTEPSFARPPTVYVAAGIHLGMYVIFMVDRKCRCV